MEVDEDDEETRAINQQRALLVLRQIIDGVYSEDDELTNTDMEVQSQVLDALKIILERSGDSLMAGWDHTITIISSVFESDKAGMDDHDHDLSLIHI